MILRYRLRPAMVTPVSEILFEYGREIDWEMETVNQSCEELTVTTDDLSLMKRLLPLCELTNSANRDRIAREVTRQEKIDRRAAERAALLARIRSRRGAYENLIEHLGITERQR